MRNRSAFTILEMMVVIALTLFIMVILAQAFGTGLDTFRDLKALGDMNEELRGVSTLLRRDLGADHFQGKRRLSDPDFWTALPREGFVRVTQGAVSFDEFQAAGIRPGNFRATTHMLHMAVKLRGNSRDSVFYTTVPNGSPLVNRSTSFFNEAPDARFQDSPTTFATPWAEVAYVLVQTGTTSVPTDPTSVVGTPLFALYRLQFLVSTDNTQVNLANVAPALAGQYAGVSCRTAATGNKLAFNCPADLTTPINRRFNPTTMTVNTFGQLTQANAGSFGGASLVLSNVVSFDVRTLLSTNVGSATRGPVGKADFEDLAFDTNAPPATAVPIKALEISIRIWDQKTGLTRQVSVVQDM